MDIAIARIVLSLIFGVAIGLIMAWVFRKDDEEHDQETNQNNLFAQQAKVPARTWIFFVLLLGVLIAGTLQVGLLTNSYAGFTLPGTWASDLQNQLNAWVPPNPSLGIEGVSVQGVLLIVLLILIGITSWFGLNEVDRGYNSWTYTALGLISATLIVASFKIAAIPTGLSIGLTGKLFAEIVLIGAVWWMAANRFETL